MSQTYLLTKPKPIHTLRLFQSEILQVSVFLPHNSVMDPGVQTEFEKFCKMADQKDEDSAFLVFDIDDVVEKVNHWREKMPRVDPFYAMKCNSDPMLLRTLAALDVGFDCASKMEIETIVNLGVPADRIVYANTCKGFSHLRRAAELKVELMTFDSEDELLKIKRLSPSAKLLLRLKIIGSSAKLLMSEKFGCNETEVPRLLSAALQHNLSVVGVSAKIGKEKITVDPLTLFHRICVAKQSDEDLKMFFTFELSPFPLSLFNEEGTKSSLFSAVTPTKIDAVQGKNNFVVVDGGHLFHKVVWQRNMTFGDIAKSYLTYLQTHYE
ncbi:Ornithine decarboxylase [Araneus ventricosus]|uniref:Ornithine decarboxylase n=1 Tax=Araneus ventricosus TaxID=182803 RepID=A0A4Y2HD83_ARAVE|nr:Ornithine decarboxylase [Araneus ventricosus]